MWGDGRIPPPGHHYTVPVALSLQLAFALPVYIGLMWLLWSGATYARSNRRTDGSTVESVASHT
jgi:hypothetical protein